MRTNRSARGAGKARSKSAVSAASTRWRCDKGMSAPRSNGKETAKKKRANVFTGRDAVRDFLDPTRSPAPPLVELPDSLNPLRADKVRIFAKLMYPSPLFNIKSIAAFNLLSEARNSGALKDVHTIVENSSGNMVLAESVLGRLFGIKRV